uniref:Uncharacterized protein n=1 Tax=Chenopodium quinoa TaxID=63459 RepID=A0A803KMN3_CHEQI
MHPQMGEDQRSHVNEKVIDCGSRLDGFKVEKSMLESTVPKLEASNDLLSSSQGSYKKDDGVPMDVDNLKGLNSRCCSSFAKDKVAFVNREKPSSCLKIARADLHKVRQGEELWLYQAHSMSLMKVRALTPKNHIMMETPHKLSLREAVISHSTPSSSIVEDDDTNKKKSSFVNEKENAYVDAEFDQVHSPHDSTYIKVHPAFRGGESEKGLENKARACILTMHILS